VFCNDGDAFLAARWLARDESDAKRRTSTNQTRKRLAV
jgi:hypothetical protein